LSIITARNYASQAEFGLKEWANLNSKYGASAKADCDMAKYMALSIKNSVHFAINDGGHIFDDAYKGLVGCEIRLPFPSITLEYFVNDGGYLVEDENLNIKVSKRLIIAEDFVDSILVSAVFFHDRSKMWGPCPVAARIPYAWDKGIDDTKLIHDSTGKLCRPFNAQVRELYPELCRMAVNQHGDAYVAHRMLSRDISGEVAAILELIEALSCKNITTEPINKIDQAKANRRFKDGKLPLYETRILTVDTSANHNEKLGMTVTDRASVRQHLRRGHIRRHPTAGNIWVQSCVVGYSELGVINKSYEVR